jgi:hypothetical protein
LDVTPLEGLIVKAQTLASQGGIASGRRPTGLALLQEAGLDGKLD